MLQMLSGPPGGAASPASLVGAFVGFMTAVTVLGLIAAVVDIQSTPHELLAQSKRQGGAS